MKRKAFLGDSFVYLIILFALAIFFVIMYYVVSQINIAWQASDFPDESKEVMSNLKNRWVGVWDGVFLFAVIGYFAIILILAFAFKSHPVFAGLAIIIMIIIGVVSVYLANIQHEILSTSTLADTASEFTFIPALMDKLPHIAVIGLVLFIIVLYAKNNSQVGI